MKVLLIATIIFTSSICYALDDYPPTKSIKKIIETPLQKTILPFPSYCSIVLKQNLFYKNKQHFGYSSGEGYHTSLGWT